MNVMKQITGMFMTGLLLMLCAWFYSTLETSFKLDKDTLASTIDATVTHLKVSQFDAEGALRNRLIAPRMQHIPKNDLHLFKSPHIIISQKDQPAWEIRSLKAKSFKGGEHIIFSKQVVVHQNQGTNIQESTLKTEAVTYYPKEKKASTDLLVTFEQPGNIIQSTGMNAYLDEKRVELLHQARGSYVPAKG